MWYASTLDAPWRLVFTRLLSFIANTKVICMYLGQSCYISCLRRTQSQARRASWSHRLWEKVASQQSPGENPYLVVHTGIERTRGSSTKGRPVPNMPRHSRLLFLRPWPPEICRKLSQMRCPPGLAHAGEGAGDNIGTVGMKRTKCVHSNLNAERGGKWTCSVGVTTKYGPSPRLCRAFSFIARSARPRLPYN